MKRVTPDEARVIGRRQDESFPVPQSWIEALRLVRDQTARRTIIDVQASAVVIHEAKP